jgi:hypothetical protein
MNGSRTFAHLQAAITAEEGRHWSQVAGEAGKAALAALALVAAISNAPAALALTTVFDVAQGAYHTGKAVWAQERGKAAEEALSTVGSACYLAFIGTGALEAMCLFAAAQVAVSLSQARLEIKEGRYLEAGGKIAMAAIRGHQFLGYRAMIERRNALLRMQKTQDLLIRLMRGRSAAHLIHHPLSELQERIEAHNVVMVDHEGKEIEFGAHFHGNGKTLVKGENIAFRKKEIDGKEVIELDFKINHAYRAQLQAAIDLLRITSQKQMRELLALSGSHVTKISVGKANLFGDVTEQLLYFGTPGEAHRIEAEGLGTLLVGAAKDEPNLYDRVIVRIDAHRSLFELHELLALINLDQAIQLSSAEDLERLKLGHLFRTFFPREATPFERTEEFFTLPLDALKEKMCALSPEMRDVYATYFHNMKPEPLLDGRIRYRIEGLAEAAYKEGARALTSAVMGGYTDEELFARVASMIRTGMLSTELRDTIGMAQSGLGFYADYYTGGADSIFAQMITEKDCRKGTSLEKFAYESKVRLLISLKALETGTYQYHYDGFGTRIYDETGDSWLAQLLSETYAKRESILEFIRKEQVSNEFIYTHEVMLKERLDPSFFTGVIVPDEETKRQLTHYLNDHGLIEDGKILDCAVDRFIRVGNRITAELIA